MAVALQTKHWVAVRCVEGGFRHMAKLWPEPDGVVAVQPSYTLRPKAEDLRMAIQALVHEPNALAPDARTADWLERASGNYQTGSAAAFVLQDQEVFLGRRFSKVEVRAGRPVGPPWRRVPSVHIKSNALSGPGYRFKVPELLGALEAIGR